MEDLELSPPRVEYGIMFRGVPVGTVGYTLMDSGSINVDWYVKEPHRGRGLAYEASKMMIEHLDSEGWFDSYEALIRPGNEASLAIANKLGFRIYRTTAENVYLTREAKNE